MRKHIRRLLIVGIAGLTLGLAACGDEPETTDTGSSQGGTAATTTDTTDAPAAPTKEADEGEPIEVEPQLLAQGFKVGQVGAILRNGKYLLLPYNTPLAMSQKPNGKGTCVFAMVNSTYEGSGSPPSIRKNSTVRISVREVTPDGAMGPESETNVAELPLSEVTPQKLGNAGLDLSKCGDTKLR